MQNTANHTAASSVSADHAHEWGLFFIRLMVGIVFIYHGSQKLFGAFGGPGLDGFSGFLETLGVPFPFANAALAGGTEFIGGLALVLGLGVRVMAVPLTITMLVASFLVHGDAFSIQNHGMEYALTLAFVVAGLGLTGPGRLSLAGLFASKSAVATRSPSET